ncbi:MAG TPA: helix-turn-helix transcriptional regulator, partial [Micromonosporaceae bacterium]|nr:helix-turn-helix transcriptional regulator [Micromonosporaceae bacterium]
PGGPTVIRILLGAQLRKLREECGISREDAGYSIRASGSKISRIELGRVSFKERDIADLLTLYGVEDEQARSELLALASQANTPGWWHRYGSVLPTWFQAYIGLETAASLIRTYEVKFIPGLLQTEDYARAVILLGHRSSSPTEIEHRVQLRMQRQRSVFTGSTGGPRIWAVVDEAALRRPVGGLKVMRAQLEKLIEATTVTEVRLQVMPFSSGGYAGAGGPFTIMRFPDEELSDVVYIEHLTNALYLDKPEETSDYAVMMDQLCVEAEPPDRTREILETALRDLLAHDG